jgi:tetratricopeptide (TPR) repeat protein
MNFDEKNAVIASLWIEFRKDEDFAHFMTYNDLGCPLAYMYQEKLITELSDQGIGMITETFNNFMKLMDVTEEDVDAVLPDKNLGAIMVFSHHKRKAAQEKAEKNTILSEHNSSSKEMSFDNENPNRGDKFSHYAHAFNAIMGTKYFSLEQISEYGAKHGEELLKSAGLGDPQALLTVATIYCTQAKEYSSAFSVAKSALDKAKAAGFDLGPYWFGYGFALEQVEEFDQAIHAHETALELGFGAAAFNYGRLMMAHSLDLGSAVRIWKIGRDQYCEYVCKEMLDDLQTSPGVYTATIPNPDGSSEILMASDNPGGLGTFK